jgi:hypothetical protein
MKLWAQIQRLIFLDGISLSWYSQYTNSQLKLPKRFLLRLKTGGFRACVLDGEADWSLVIVHSSLLIVHC